MKRFDSVATLETASGDGWTTMFEYLAFFQHGPKPYRDAFAAFLKDAAATGDVETAQATRLLSLDQEKLWEAINEYVKELKTVKPK